MLLARGTLGLLLNRSIRLILEKIAQEFPVVAIMGPLGAGKSTLAQMAFEQHRYVSLEDLDLRLQAETDPRGFLDHYQNSFGIILDEIQHVPGLLSYIQTKVDREKQPGYFILTGSQNFLVNQAVSQTLAGRMAILTLLPLTIDELQASGKLPNSLEALVYQGCYPGLYEAERMISVWYSSYITSYIERDVRQVTKVGDLAVFKLFLRLCAGRIGQLLNVSSLANDCGISYQTAQNWLSLLEASYIIKLLQPHYKNFSKRLIKQPKIYFYDTGLACALLGIESPDQVVSHYLRGGLVENLIIMDLHKQCYNLAREPQIYFWRDNHGSEIDCLLEKGVRLVPVEIKAGKTLNLDFFKTLGYWSELAGQSPQDGFVVYGGDENKQLSHGRAIGWRSVHQVLDFLLRS